MTRQSKRTPIVVAMLISSLLAAGTIATPASGKTLHTKTFRPVHKTRHALFFAPRSVSADAVRRARVGLRNRRTGASRVRRVRVAKVSRTIVRGSRLRVEKAPRVSGRLKIEVGGPSEPTPTPSPSVALPSLWQRSASFESTPTDGTDGWRVDSPFDVTRTNEVGGTDGDYAEKIVTNGGNRDCSCARMKFEDGFSFGPGDDVWISGSWLIPNPSKVSWSRLMNLGHFEESGSDRNWYLALESTNAGTMQVGYAPYANPHVAVLPARPIPADRWFRVDLHFHLSPTDGQALTEWYLDKQFIGSTTKANMLSSDPLHFFNAGLPFFGPWNGDTTVYFDAPRLTP